MKYVSSKIINFSSFFIIFSLILLSIFSKLSIILELYVNEIFFSFNIDLVLSMSLKFINLIISF